jgi:soluble lytic murein transglycosylase-like protein
MTSQLIPIVISLTLVSGCWAAERVCLKSGFCLEADSHNTAGQTLALQRGSGSIEVSARDVESIEALPSSAAPEKNAPLLPDKLHADPQAILNHAADAEGVDRDFVRSVAKIESDFRQNAKSTKGALGLMQIMPSTAKELLIDATQPSGNALGGAKYLRELLIRYHYNSALALAAYNAGPGAVQRFGGIPPYAETKSYIAKVTREYDRCRAEAAKPKRTSPSQYAANPISSPIESVQ